MKERAKATSRVRDIRKSVEEMPNELALYVDKFMEEIRFVIGYKPIKKDPNQPNLFGYDQIVPSNCNYYEERPEFYKKIYAGIPKAC